MIPMPFKWVLGCFYHDPKVGVKFALAEASDSLACWVEEAHGNQSEGYKILEVERGGGGGGEQSVQVQKMRKKGKDLASW